jgi:hypothetical protein
MSFFTSRRSSAARMSGRVNGLRQYDKKPIGSGKLQSSDEVVDLYFEHSNFA